MHIPLTTEQHFKNLLELKDTSASTFLFETYGAVINGIVRRICPEIRMSDSVFQKTFMHIWTNIRNYDQRKCTLYTWMISQTRIYLKEVGCGLHDTSKTALSNNNIIDLSYAYTKDQISVALDVPLNIIDNLVLSAINRIRYNKGEEKENRQDNLFVTAKA